MTTLYQAIIQAGIETSHWQSDLYFPVTKESTEILKAYPNQCKSTFKNNIDSTLWYDCNFAYDPFWPHARA